MNVAIRLETGALIEGEQALYYIEPATNRPVCLAFVNSIVYRIEYDNDNAVWREVPLIIG